MSTVEELQSALDRAKEKLQSNNSLLIDKEKQISRLSADIDTVSISIREGRGQAPFVDNMLQKFYSIKWCR